MTLTATASSGLPVTFSSSALSVCGLNAGVLTPLAEGTCTISADQVGNAEWEAAPTVEHTITVVAADSDGDGVNDDEDAFPNDPTRSVMPVPVMSALASLLLAGLLGLLGVRRLRL